MPSYEAEISFFQQTLRQLNLPSNRITRSKALLPQVDKGLRATFAMEQEERPWEQYTRLHMKKNTIYRITDEFSCSYVMFLLPDRTDDEVLAVGPFLLKEFSDEWLENFFEKNSIRSQWFPVLNDYFRDIKYLRLVDLLNAALNALGECIWGVHQFATEDVIDGIPDTLGPLSAMPEPHVKENFMLDVRALEARYDAENRLMQAVAQGRTHRARMMLSGFSQSALQNRASEPVRNTQNYSIILNTILRKAAEQGGVHPLYIDRLSTDFARRIEQTALWEDFSELWQEMAHKYCLMVKKHSNQKYSQLVQQVISRVDYDLAADLSLKANAEALNVNASYLSALFKKEMGLTLTDYVNRKRVEHAVYLLNNTNLSISAVGQYCGIQDDNYFTKMFKKYTEKTPKQFRQENSRFPK